MNLARESSLTGSLNPMERKGFVAVQSEGRGRQGIITLTQRGKMSAGFALPDLGCVPAGHLRQTVEDADNWINNLHRLLPYKPGDFLLRVDGESMIGDNVVLNDLVPLRLGIEVNSCHTRSSPYYTRLSPLKS